MKTKSILLSLGASALLIGINHAQEPKKKKGPREEPTPEMLEKYDKDGDGKLSREERRAARKGREAELLKDFDKDGDGKLSKEERREARKAMRKQMTERRTASFKEADKDGSGTLTLEEFSAMPEIKKIATSRPEAPAKLYQGLDKDQNGSVELQEFVQAGQKGRKGKGKGKNKRQPAEN